MAELKDGMIPVNFADLETAVEFVSNGLPTEHRAYISIDTGAIYWISESGDIDEDAPEDLGESDRYLDVPSKSDLGVGPALAFRFTEERIPGEYAAVRQFFAHRGAYARFKELLAAHELLDSWYAFEAERTRRAILDWQGLVLRANGAVHLDPETLGHRPAVEERHLSARIAGG